MKVNGAWVFFPAVVETNGKLKDKVRVKGADRGPSRGPLLIEWWEGAKRKREHVPERTELLDRARRKSPGVEAARIGVPVAALERGKSRARKGQPSARRLRLLENIKPPQREPRTYIAYKCCLETFAATCKYAMSPT